MKENAKPRINRGGRISSAKFRHSIEQCEEFTGLDSDTNRYDILLLVKRVGKGAGFSPRMIHLLDYYISFTRDCDWVENARPIIYQSLSKTALDMGVSERQIQKLEKTLFEIGAITWNDSGNHRRYGRRDPETGVILYAYGVDLTPLAYLKTELEAKHIEKKERDRVWMEAKRQISYYRRQIKAYIAELKYLEEEGDFIDPPVYDLENKYNEISMAIRTYMDINYLQNLLATHKALYERVLNIFENAHKGSSQDEQKFANNKNTNKKQSNKLDTSRPEVISIQKEDRGFKISNNKQTSKQIDWENGKEKNQEVNPQIQAGLHQITLKQVLNSTSERFREHLPLKSNPLDWDDLINTSYKIKTDLGISQGSWANACQVLGRVGAAICLVLTDHATTREKNSVRIPPAYFKAMINRAEKGELHLHNSVFGILKKDRQNDLATVFRTT